MKHYKTGRWSKEEIQFINDNHKSMSIDELSEHINRPTSKIAEMVGELHIPDEIRQMEMNIKRTHEWKQITQQLSEDEQETFLYHWREIINQFKQDITHTERLQVMDTIRTEILINRVLKRMYFSQELIETLQQQLKDEKAKDPKDYIAIGKLNEDITNCFIAISNFQKENQTLMERKQSMLREMKATRAERKKRFEESKETLKDWVASLITNPDVRKSLGIEIEKFRIAMNAEYERLSDYHQYVDGTVEQPVLNSDNIKEDNL